jgi:hypothetical protein
VLWFYEMVMAFVPWRRERFTPMPDPYVAPNPQGKVADRITREPAVAGLDENWTGAVRQREKLVMWQVGNGAPVPGKIQGFEHVVDVTETAAEDAR